MVRDAKRLGHRPKPGQIKSLKGFLEGIDLGGGSCASHSDIAARVLTSDPRSQTGHVTRDKIGRDLAYWVRIGLLTRRWKTIMLSNMQPTRKYVYQVARRVMTALKSLGRLVRRAKDNAHSLQGPYPCSGRVVSQWRGAGIQRPQSSLADLIRKYHGDAAADVYIATHTGGEECLEAEQAAFKRKESEPNLGPKRDSGRFFNAMQGRGLRRVAGSTETSSLKKVFRKGLHRALSIFSPRFLTPKTSCLPSKLADAIPW
jgi:hypothetical protein